MGNDTFDAGVRCGHIDGWANPGTDEREAADLISTATPDFRAGYRLGYKLGAARTKLSKSWQYPVATKPKNWL